MDGITFCVDTDIIKEAKILQYFTQHKTVISNYIANFVDLFESESHYFLVTEYIDHGMTLRKFIQTAKSHLKSGKLKFKEYHKKIKFIFWQLMTTLTFFHEVYYCYVLTLYALFLQIFKSDVKISSIFPRLSFESMFRKYYVTELPIC